MLRKLRHDKRSASLMLALLLLLFLLLLFFFSTGSSLVQWMSATTPSSLELSRQRAFRQGEQRQLEVLSSSSSFAFATTPIDNAAPSSLALASSPAQQEEGPCRDNGQVRKQMAGLPPPTLPDLLFHILVTHHGEQIAQAIYEEGYMDAVIATLRSDIDAVRRKKEKPRRSGGEGEETSKNSSNGADTTARDEDDKLRNKIVVESDKLFRWKERTNEREHQQEQEQKHDKTEGEWKKRTLLQMPEIEPITWNMDKRRAQADFPRSFPGASNPGKMRTRIKLHFSLALGRIAHDQQLARMYERLLLGSGAYHLPQSVFPDNSSSSSPTSLHQQRQQQQQLREELRLFRRAMAKILNSNVQYFLTLVQLLVDVTRAASAASGLRKNLLDDLAALRLDQQQRQPQHGGSSCWRRANYYPPTKSSSSATTSGALHALPKTNLAAPSYDAQSPRNGKFWSMLRPTLQCTTLTRLCETPDGCRFLCNAEFMKFGNVFQQDERREDGEKNRLLHFAGFGSNNEYEWEESLLATFGSQAEETNQNSAKKEATNRVGSITTFDCTLGTSDGKRPWQPPPPLIQQPIGFGHASKCIDREPTAVSISMPQVRNFILTGDSTSSSSSSANNKKTSVTRYATAQRSGENRKQQRLAILKLDIEGYEFVVVPQWLRSELVSLALSSSSSSSAAPQSYHYFDYTPSAALPNFFAVDTLQMEFHRMGHKSNHGASAASSLHAHLFLLHMHSLGFMMVGQERNHIDNCCFEFAFAHYNYFVRSEIWMGLNAGES